MACLSPLLFIYLICSSSGAHLLLSSLEMGSGLGEKNVQVAMKAAKAATEGGAPALGAGAHKLPQRN